MTESQSEHRMEMEKIVVIGDSRRSNIGIACAFILSLIILAIGAYAVIGGDLLGGAAIIGVDIAVLAGVFVYGTNARRRERERKASEP